MENIDLCGHIHGELSRDHDDRVIIWTILKITYMLRYPHIHFTLLHSSPLWQNSHWKSRFDTKNLGNEGDIFVCEYVCVYVYMYV